MPICLYYQLWVPHLAYLAFLIVETIQKSSADGTRSSGPAVSFIALTARDITSSKYAFGCATIVFCTVVQMGSWYLSHIESQLWASMPDFSTSIQSRAAKRMKDSLKLEPWSTIILLGSPVSIDVQHLMSAFQTVVVSIFLSLTAAEKRVPSSIMCKIECFSFFLSRCKRPQEK